MLNRIIVRHEFQRIVFTRRFLITTLGMPFFIACYVGLVSVIGWLAGNRASSRASAKPYAVVDNSRLTQSLFQAIPAGGLYTYRDSRSKDEEPDRPQTLQLKAFSGLEDAKQALIQKEVAGLLRIPPDVMQSGQAQYFAVESSGFFQPEAPFALLRLLHQQVVASAGVAPQLQTIVKEGVALEQIWLNSQGQEQPGAPAGAGASKIRAELVNRGSKYLLVAVMIFVILNNLTLFSISTRRERESKLIDIMMSSVQAEELVLGKVAGIVGASLLQLIVWLAMVSALPALLAISSKMSLDLHLDWLRFSLSLALVIAGMVFFGLLMSGVGALTKEYSDSLGGARILQIVFIMSIYLSFLLLMGASDLWWRIFSLIPLYTPFLVPIQLTRPEYSSYEAFVYLAIMLMAVLLLAKFAGRLLRLGVMLQGQEVGLAGMLKTLFSRDLVRPDL